MKRPAPAFTLLLALILLPAVGHGEPQAPDPGPEPDMQVNGRATPCVQLRSGASTNRSVLDCLEPGTRLRALGNISGWSHVRLLDGTEGWVDSGYLEVAPTLTGGQPEVATAEPDPGPAPDMQVNGRATPCVRLRSGASTNRTVLDCLEPGTRLRALGNISSWSHVRLLDGTEGWVDSGYLEVAPTLPGGQPEVATAEPGRQMETAPPTPGQPPDDFQGQIHALEGQLQAMSALREATEERLRKTVVAAEAAQREASQLRQQVQQMENEATPGDRAEPVATDLAAGRARVTELEEALAAAEGQLLRAAGLNAEQEQRIEALDTSLAAAKTSQAERQRALATAQQKLRSAEETAARQATRISQLEAAPPPDSPRRAELKRELKDVKSQLRRAEETNAELAGRIAQLQTDLPSAEGREAELHQALAAAEQRETRQAQRIEALTGELADAERRIAEVTLKSRLANRPEAATGQPAESRVRVRAPIVSAPEPPRVPVRMPAAVRDEAAAPPPETPIEAPIPPTDAAINAIRAWAAAWSDQRVDDYLSFYAPGFQPPNGLSRGDWEAQRRQRLRRPRFIRVTISGLSAELADDGTVTATFRQDYQSDTFADRVTKTMTLAEEDGTWQMLAEQTTP